MILQFWSPLLNLPFAHDDGLCLGFEFCRDDCRNHMDHDVQLMVSKVWVVYDEHEHGLHELHECEGVAKKLVVHL